MTRAPAAAAWEAARAEHSSKVAEAHSAASEAAIAGARAYGDVYDDYGAYDWEYGGRYSGRGAAGGWRGASARGRGSSESSDQWGARFTAARRAHVEGLAAAAARRMPEYCEQGGAAAG